MKKRLLALALCLVMTVSLLPITAAAEVPTYHVNSVEIEADGVYWDGSVYRLNITYWKIVCDNGTIIDINDKDTLTYAIFSNVDCSIPANLSEEGTQYLAVCEVGFWRSMSAHFVPTETTSYVLRIPGYESVRDDIISPNGGPCVTVGFILTKEHDHDWRFTQTDSTLTATCQKSTCPTKEVSVSLKADSVTLPNSPFNARLEGLEQFKKEIPNAVIGEFVYKYKGPEDSTFGDRIDPIPANAKAGEYQVGVRISGLLVDKEYPPVAYSLEDGVNQGVGDYADLYVQYTAVDPAVTAQTGDNRPIELMMAGVLVFSALAAAAFILDHKRKYSR